MREDRNTEIVSSRLRIITGDPIMIAIIIIHYCHRSATAIIIIVSQTLLEIMHGLMSELLRRRRIIANSN